MILVESGTFIMGNTFGDGYYDEKPTHRATVSGFYIGKYLVTQKEYKSLIGNNPSYFKGDDLPVETVSWFDAIKYCNAKSKTEGLPVAYNESTGDLLDSLGNITTDVTQAKGYRLPTEAEWEYAVKGGTSTYKYSGSNDVGSVAWYWDNSGSKSHPVGTKKSNELGIYDMSGNVWEWCQDWYDDYNGTNSVNRYIYEKTYGRVLRGGGWNNDAGDMRVTNRYFGDPTDRDFDVGFRVVRSV